MSRDPGSIGASTASVLLALARESIALAFSEREPVPPEPRGEDLDEVRGAFVTLKNSGSLRGCIGRVETEWPLWETVVRMARASAFDDPRFPPLSVEELAEVEIEISVLTPPRRIASPDDIVVGTHGLIVELGPRRGLLLPQVATDYGWDRVEFLENTCLKAGVPPDAWRDPETLIYAFSADVFAETAR